MASISPVPKYAELNQHINHLGAQRKSLEYYVESPHIFKRNFGLVISFMQQEVGSFSYQLSLRLQKAQDIRPDALLDKPLKTFKETNHLIEALDLPLSLSHQEKKAEEFVVQDLSCEYLRNMQRIEKCVDFLKEPYAAYPIKLPYMTQQVALGILQGCPSPFEKELWMGEIGVGTSCHVDKVLVGQTLLAKKKYDPDIQKDKVIEEYQKTLMWSHPSIVRVAHLDDSNLYLEYVEGSPLSKTQLSLEEGLSIYLSLLQLISYIHLRRQMHGDVHGENVIISLDKQRCTLIDFGCCDVFDEDQVYEGDIELLSYHLEKFFLKMKSELSSSLFEEYSDLKKWYQQRQYLDEDGLPYERMEAFLEKCLKEIRLKKRRLA